MRMRKEFCYRGEHECQSLPREAVLLQFGVHVKVYKTFIEQIGFYDPNIEINTDPKRYFRTGDMWNILRRDSTSAVLRLTVVVTSPFRLC